MRLVLMGPPGAGKGTQGDRLSEEFDVPRFATGDMLRDARRAETDLGRQAREYMDAGELVPDEVIVDVVRDALHEPEAASGFILDGFPRTLEQAEGLAEILTEREETLDGIVNIQVPEEELVRRLTSRRVCEGCGAVAPVTDGSGEDACAKCGGELVTREDDRPETVRRRLEVYREETEPVLERYRRSTTPLEEVDGTGAVEEVTERILDAVGEE